MANSSSGALSPGGHGEGQRTSVSAMPEELTLDYTEINSIPPLPLWTLLGKNYYFRFANRIRISYTYQTTFTNLPFFSCRSREFQTF